MMGVSPFSQRHLASTWSPFWISGDSGTKIPSCIPTNRPDQIGRGDETGLTTTTAAADGAPLHLLQLGLQLLDLGMCLLKILVKAIALSDEFLFPLPEALLLNLDLLGEALAQRLFLLLELGVVELAGAGLAKLASLHLPRAVRL